MAWPDDTVIVVPQECMEDFEEVAYITDLPQLQEVPFLKTYPFRWWFDPLKAQYVFVLDEDCIADSMEEAVLRACRDPLAADFHSFPHHETVNGNGDLFRNLKDATISCVTTLDPDQAAKFLSQLKSDYYGTTITCYSRANNTSGCASARSGKS